MLMYDKVSLHLTQLAIVVRNRAVPLASTERLFAAPVHFIGRIDHHSRSCDTELSRRLGQSTAVLSIIPFTAGGCPIKMGLLADGCSL